MILSNGVKVIVKPTDYKDDEILFQAFRKGGKATYSPEDAADILMIGDAVSLSDVGPFDNKAIARYLTGKNVKLEYGVGNFTDYLEGSSSVKDLPTLFELIYTSFTNINPNEENYDNSTARIIPRLEAAEKSPEFIFEKHKNNAVYAGNPMAATITADVLKKADYKRMLQLYKESVANPADFTLLFTGNVDMETLKPLLEQYVASLPTYKKEDRKVIAPVNTADGEVADSFTTEMTSPADWLYGIYSGTNVDNTIQDHVKTSLVGDIVRILYTEILREKEGGVYSPAAYSYYDINNGKWIFADLLKEYATADQFNRVKGALLSQYENNVRTNSYWHDNIRLYELLGKDFITGHRSAIEDLTLEDFNAFMRNLYDGKNRIQVNMHGIAN